MNAGITTCSQTKTGEEVVDRFECRQIIKAFGHLRLAAPPALQL